jgi:hypothetical protein
MCHLEPRFPGREIRVESAPNLQSESVALSNHDDPLDSPGTEWRIGPPLRKGDKKPFLEKKSVKVIGMFKNI